MASEPPRIRNARQSGRDDISESEEYDPSWEGFTEGSKPLLWAQRRAANEAAYAHFRPFLPRITPQKGGNVKKCFLIGFEYESPTQVRGSRSEKIAFTIGARNDLLLPKFLGATLFRDAVYGHDQQPRM